MNFLISNMQFLNDPKGIWLEFFAPALDFLMIALLIYALLCFIKGTKAACILAGIVVALLSLTMLSELLRFTVLAFLLNKFWTFSPLALIVIFQPELRSVFAQLGSNFQQQSSTQSETIQEIVEAARALTRTKTGALIVFERHIGMAAFKAKAVSMDAKVSSFLLQSIFYPNSPLHDGAVIISGDKIQAAHAILPLTLQPEYAASQSIGTRHRAAVGITEETDAVAVVCSEETGSISIAMKGILERHISPERLSELLADALIDVRASEKTRVNEEGEDVSV